MAGWGLPIQRRGALVAALAAEAQVAGRLTGTEEMEGASPSGGSLSCGHGSTAVNARTPSSRSGCDSRWPLQPQRLRSLVAALAAFPERGPLPCKEGVAGATPAGGSEATAWTSFRYVTDSSRGRTSTRLDLPSASAARRDGLIACSTSSPLVRRGGGAATRRRGRRARAVGRPRTRRHRGSRCSRRRLRRCCSMRRCRPTRCRRRRPWRRRRRASCRHRRCRTSPKIPKIPKIPRPLRCWPSAAACSLRSRRPSRRCHRRRRARSARILRMAPG